ncbi:DOPA 4,5-dioxygenase family protein [Vibrio sp. AK197]
MRFPQNIYQRYHAHVYFDEQSLEKGEFLYAQLQSLPEYQLGRFHQKLVGPHTKWSFQIAFTRDQFDQLIPWLERHRQGLSILVHGNTGDFYQDHTEHAYWLGDEQKLNLKMS